jgi:hypothetical protein
LRPYALALLATFALFSLLFKWQPWASRLQLPAYFLWAPALAVIVGRKGAAVAVVTGLFVWTASIPWLVGNATRPLGPLLQPEGIARRREYFAKRSDVYPAYLAVTDRITQAGCDRVGLELEEDSWEYPIWVLLRDRGFSGEIQHISVENASRIYEDRTYRPCAIIRDRGSGGITVRLQPGS